METQFNSVADAATLDDLFARSRGEAVVLFKHSTTCPISSAAYREMSKLGEAVALVVVQTARDISCAVEARTGVRHESPQTIILRNGEAVWSASHYDITSDAVRRALNQQSATGAAG